jgi:hypothetical protein
MGLTFCHLRAKGETRGVERRYSLLVQRDLFGGWVVITEWGREGSREQRKQYVFSNEREARRKFEEILRRRLNGKKRVGCNYQIVEKR